MNAYAIVFFGAGIGGALRHAVNVLAARVLGVGFPFGTLTVNIVGSFAMGLIAGYFSLKGDASQSWRLFLTTGVLGGFTTFSAYSLDMALLWERNDIIGVTVYAGASVACAIGGLFLGLWIVRSLP